MDRFRTRQTAGALAYLAYFPERSHTREELIELLWPEAGNDSGRQNLSTVLTSLRKLLEPPGAEPDSVLMASRETVILRPEAISTDVREFTDALRAAEREPSDQQHLDAYEDALGLYAGPLLPGRDEAWVLAERERLQEEFGLALAHAARACLDTGQALRAIPLARRAVATEPFRESHHLLLALLKWECGDRKAALGVLNDWDRTVTSELGGGPSAKAVRLRAAIESGPSPRPSSTSNRQVKVAAVSSVDPVPNGVDRDGSEPHLKALGRVPSRFSRFFGREKEIAQIEARLSSDCSTLLTLTGPGGIGKTRLAIEVARRMQEKGESTAWFVSLADLRDSEHIAARVAEVLGLSPAEATVPRISDFLSRAPAVLILDNAEHLPGIAVWIGTLIEHAPGLHVIVTSRQGLGLEAESELAVSSLPVPEQESDPAHLLAMPAVALFVDRAQRSRPDFQITTRNAAAIASLCGGLEGIPLALELAAARSQVLTPAQMLGQLEDRFSFLVDRKRPITERHRTMAAAIQWSYDLLPPELQRFFVELSVFRGGWTAAAASVVLEQPRATALLEELVNSSLVRADEGNGAMRFGMLETMRAFGRKHREEATMLRLRAAHAAYYLELAERDAPLLGRPAQAEWLARVGAEQDNLYKALEFAAEHDPLLGLRLAIAASTFWEISANTVESRRWLGTFLSKPDPFPDDLRAVALVTAGNMCTWAGEFLRTKEYLTECLEIGRRLGRFELIGSSLPSLAFALSNLRDPTVWSVLEEGSELADRLGAAPLKAAMLLCRGMEQAFAGDYDASLESCTAGYALGKEIGDHFLTGRLSASLGSVSLLKGNVEDAELQFREALEPVASVNDLVVTGIAHWGLSLVALCRGDFDGFAEHWGQHDKALKRSGVLWGYPHLIESASAAELACRREHRAVVLFAAAEALRIRLHLPQPVGNRGFYQELFDALPGLRLRPDLKNAWRFGAGLSWEEAAEYARSDRDLPKPTSSSFLLDPR